MPTVIDVPFRSPRKDSPECEVLDLHEFLTVAGHVARSPHRISFFQLLLITGGSGTHWIDFEPYHYRRGSLFLVSKGQTQTFDPAPGTTGFVVFFTEQHLYQGATDLEWLLGLASFNSLLAPAGVALPEDENDEIVTMIGYMKVELANPPDLVRTDILRNLLKVIILKAERVKRAQCHLENRALQPDHDLYLRFREMLETDYASSRGVQEYAAALTVTPKRLNKITHAYLGKPAKQVIDDRVVLEIKRLLSYSDLTVQEIAFLLGFNDPTNMTKFFKRYAHVTPGQFKASFKQTHSDRILAGNHL